VVYRCKKAAWEGRKTHFDTNHMVSGPPAPALGCPGSGKSIFIGYRSAFRPLRSGLGGEAPLRGLLKNSESGTSRVAASRSNTSTVGFSVRRSKPPTYALSTSASQARRSCERPRLTLSRLRFQATNARPCRKARMAEPIKPRDIAILFLIVSHPFTFGKPVSARKSQLLSVICIRC
jgi:hypothetical protein